MIVNILDCKVRPFGKNGKADINYIQDEQQAQNNKLYEHEQAIEVIKTEIKKIEHLPDPTP